MSKNIKQTSVKVAKLAAETLRDKGSSQIAKSLAASALSQRNIEKQTGSRLEEVAAKVLAGNRYATETKTLAATVLSQSNKDR